MGHLLAQLEGDVSRQRFGKRPKRSSKKGKGGVLHFNLTSEQLAEGGLICGGNIDIFLEPLKEEFLRIYQEVVKIKQKGGSAILATLISVDDDFPKVEGLKVLIKPSGEKIGFLFDGEGLEKKVLRRRQSIVKGERAQSYWF